LFNLLNYIIVNYIIHYLLSQLLNGLFVQCQLLLKL
jgi:hypothetical protein